MPGPADGPVRAQGDAGADPVAAAEAAAGVEVAAVDGDPFAQGGQPVTGAVRGGDRAEPGGRQLSERLTTSQTRSSRWLTETQRSRRSSR